MSFRALKKEEEKVLGVFPVFKNSEFELSYSEKEMLAIKKIFSGLFLSNNKATYANFKKNALDYSILHISTHASSGDADVPANIRFYDQEVMYSELYNLEINPNLIVLSACETGIGKWYKGEGAMSVARGFQFSGAQNFLFSLWKVNDYTTSKLMENFYENIHYKYSYSAGIQEAKIQFLSDSNIANVKKSPYYWAAFVYYGSLENHNTNYFWGWIFISVIVIGFIIVLMWKFRKRFVCKKN